MNWKRSTKVILVNLCALAAVFAVAELVLRRHINRTALFEGDPIYRYDGRLGWSPKPGRHARDYGKVTIDPDGFRRCPAPASLSGPKVLACGDSFTFGYHVSDEAAWPCQLASLIDGKVLNAGISGYGLDQMVLRMKDVIGEVGPDLVIISIIADSVNRSAMSMRGRHKPYYEIIDGRPVLRNVPVPPPSASGELPRWWYERLAVVEFFSRLVGIERQDFHIAHGQEMAVAQYLFQKARELCRQHGSVLLVVIQPIHDWRIGRRMQEDLERFLVSADIPVLNLYPLMEEAFPSGEARRNVFSAHHRHLSGEGYRWVAEQIARFIAEYDLLAGGRF